MDLGWFFDLLSQGHVYWAMVTLMWVFLPFLVEIVIFLTNWITTKTFSPDKNFKKCFLLFPFVAPGDVLVYFCILFFLRIESYPSCLWKCVESIQFINHRNQWLFNYVKLIKRLRRFSKHKVILYIIAPSSGDKVISFQLEWYLTWPDPDTDLWLAAALFELTRYWPMIGWNSVTHTQLSWTSYKLGTMFR